MPTTAAASPPRTMRDEVVADLTRESRETQVVPTLLVIANAIRSSGLTPEPRFLRDHRGHVVGIEVVAS